MPHEYYAIDARPADGADLAAALSFHPAQCECPACPSRWSEPIGLSSRKWMAQVDRIMASLTPTEREIVSKRMAARRR